jgi:hypothetical protein
MPTHGKKKTKPAHKAAKKTKGVKTLTQNEANQADALA